MDFDESRSRVSRARELPGTERCVVPGEVACGKQIFEDETFARVGLVFGEGAFGGHG